MLCGFSPGIRLLNGPRDKQQTTTNKNNQQQQAVYKLLSGNEAKIY